MTTKQPRKQRKALAEAPWHRRRKLMSAHLAEEYLEERKRTLPRAIPVRKGDIVRVIRGEYRGREGKVAGVDYRRLRITIEQLTYAKADKTQVAKPIHPSNVIIKKLDETDPLRLKRFTVEKKRVEVDRKRVEEDRKRVGVDTKRVEEDKKRDEVEKK